MCFLLWHRRLPTRAELGDLQTQLAEARVLPEPIVRLLNQLPSADGMDMLRTLTSALAHYDKDARDNSAAASYRKAVRLTGQLASLVAAMGRVEAGKGLVAPDPALSHAANFLYMLTGDRPEADRRQGLRHRADAARRPRAERLDVRRARDRGARCRTSTRRSSAASARSRARCTAAPTPT